MIEATAPVRICDLGGWTDTWFGGPGRVLNIAVDPGVRIRVASIRAAGRTEVPVTLRLDSFDLTYPVVPGSPRAPRHPLLEAALDLYPPPPDSMPVEIAISSPMPPGSGIGTSASVSVALLGALCHLRGESLSASELAYRAHDLEANHLGMEGGIQDQLCAALGGISFLDISDFPQAEVTRLDPWDELGALLTLVYLGRSHDSPAIHRAIIDSAANSAAATFQHLRNAAMGGRDAVIARDLRAFGAAMVANTEAQARLDPSLVGPDASAAIELAQNHKALGWKVNGAGGDGGSLTLLSSDPPHKVQLEDALRSHADHWRILPITLNAAGVQVHKT